MRILAIDTSNQTMSVAVCEDNRIVGEYTTTINKNHSLTLMPAINQLMQDVKLPPSAIDRVVVAQGPGSYTGLRIGVTTAKTIAYTLHKELVGISSLLTLAANCVNQKGLIVPLFNARRENVYAGAYQFSDGEWLTHLSDGHMSLTSLLDQLKAHPNLYFVGEDVALFQEKISQVLPQAVFNQIPQWQIPNAAILAQLGGKVPAEENIHAFLPKYLKRVEAEENWLKEHSADNENYVEKI